MNMSDVASLDWVTRETSDSDNVRAVSIAKLLTLSDVAEQLGLEYKTIRNYHQVAEKRRRDGGVRPGDFPPPDGVFGKSPVWKQSTVDRWVRRRPGRGVGGGRPPKREATRP